MNLKDFQRLKPGMKIKVFMSGEKFTGYRYYAVTGEAYFNNDCDAPDQDSIIARNDSGVPAMKDVLGLDDLEEHDEAEILKVLEKYPEAVAKFPDWFSTKCY
ncbi:MAG: hypothetical protein K6G19_06100 [Lachnospiraceae bacterium]|nr:hypothetical protein [Lachnospiraceae bacterium]